MNPIMGCAPPPGAMNRAATPFCMLFYFGKLPYTEAKQPFIWQVIAQADEWAQLTGWMPGPPDA